MFIFIVILYIFCRNSYIFWSDVAAGAIYRANMDGTGAEIIASDNIYIVGKTKILQRVPQINRCN